MMRILFLALALFLTLPAVPGFAQAVPGAETDTLETVRRETKSVLLATRDWTADALATVKGWTGLSDDQLLGAGIGGVTGLVLADMIGFGGLFSAAAAIGGAYVGKWVVDAPTVP